jgi:hypothetical protein
MKEPFVLKKPLLAALVAAALISACQPAPTLIPTIAMPTNQPPAPTLAAEPTQPAQTPVDPNPTPQAYPMGETPAATPPPIDGAGSYPPPSGEYWVVYPPVPEDAALERGEFLLDALTVQLDPSQPGTADLSVEGALPTPCHQPRVEVSAPDAQNAISLNLYTVVSTEMACAQVIQPYNEKIATLTALAPGSYTVVSAGQQVAEFSVP